MKVHPKARPSARDKPEMERRCIVWMTDSNGFGSLTCQGYTTLAQNPEVTTAVNTIARLVGSMTIHLMRNTESGDIRVRNGLSDIVDIEPNRYMTRSNFVQWIVRTLYLEGRGNAVVWPQTENGYLRQLVPVPASFVSFIPSGDFGYRVDVAGREYDPDDLLHFALNPGSYYPWRGDGFTFALSDVADDLKQAAATKKGFLQTKWKPAVIIRVDGFVDAMSTQEGRDKLLNKYVEAGEAGKPWLLPAEQMSVEQIKPLSLSDLALADFVNIDKKTVAAILGVPPFVLGVGEFKRDEWNSFVNTTIMPLAQCLQQELTRKLLYASDLYFRFSSRSLFSYDLRDMATVADEQYVRGIMTGNEVRDWLGLSPLEGLDELIILENYIPRGMIAEQSKLSGGDSG